MRTGKSLSDFWRFDRSDNRALELISILQGADSLIGNMGSDIQVTWSGGGVSYTNLEQRIVALDYGPLRDDACPFHGSIVDEVIGYAAHEGGHCQWSIPFNDRATKHEIQNRWRHLPGTLQWDWQAHEQAVLSELHRIQNILEDAYIDCQVAKKWPILGEYIRIARRRLKERTPIDLAAIARDACPNRNAIINLWVDVSLYGHSLPSSAGVVVKQAMDSLQELTRKAIKEENGIIRQIMAVQAAIIIWQRFPVKDGPLPVLPQDSNQATCQQTSGIGSSQSQGATEARHGTSLQDRRQDSQLGNLDDFDPARGPEPSGRSVVPVPQQLLEDVAQAVAGEVEDLSWPVAQALAEDPRQIVARAKKGVYDPEMANMVNSQVQPEIRGIQQAFRQQHDMNTRWLYGLDRGRLDTHRLWKPFVGESGYFKRKDVVGRPSLAVGLLLDVSQSMSRYMPIVKQTAAVFSQGLMQMPGINFAAWCYTGRGGRVALTRICDRKLPNLCLANVEQGGGTPSGAAIAGAKVLLEQMLEKRHLLIHFTDGQPDSPTQVLKAVQACREAGIRVYAIGVPQFQWMLHGQYGEGNYETIQEVLDLPQALSRIVKKLGTSQL